VTAPKVARPLVSRRIGSVAFSPTVEMSQRASEMRARGERVLDFSVGEPDQDTPTRIAKAAVRALNRGVTRYTPSAGLPELRAAIAQRYNDDYATTYAPENAVATDGAKHALYTVCQCVLNPGDEVIIPAPFWPSFAEAVRLAGAKPVAVHTSAADGFLVDSRQINRAITARTRALILNTPSNPTGAVIGGEDLLALGRVAKRKKLMVLLDDTYAKLMLERQTPVPLAELSRLLGDQLVIIGTASKTYCMTGWRIGWALGASELVGACATLISHSTQCPTSFAQAGAVAALTGSQGFVRSLEKEFRRRLRIVYPQLISIPDVRCTRPAGGFYVFPNVSAYLGGSVKTSLELGLRLLEEEKLAIVPGEGFAAPGFLRMSIARPVPELTEGVGRLAAFLGRLSVERG